jgi:surfeit locus 1 family protein
MTDRQAARQDAASRGAAPRTRLRLVVLALFATLAFAAFAALGTWQLVRLQWKLALIDRVTQRVHAPPVPAPAAPQWPQVSAETDEYRHVRVSGMFLYDRTARVQASTVLGSGYWLLTPLRGEDGSIVLVNRGFVPADSSPKAGAARPDEATAGQVSSVTGLLRMSEPGGGFLRKNDPAADRWYSRDVQAIAQARGLSHVAPYFVDADRADTPAAPGRPVGGLTVVAFHNNHLIYALTWYALALMVAGAAFWMVREEKRTARYAARTPHSSDRSNANDEPD